VPFDIKIVRFSISFVLPWKPVHALLGHFCQHCFWSISVEDISTKFATHIKHVVLMFQLIFSVENHFSVVMEKVIIYGNGHILDIFHSKGVALWVGDVYMTMSSCSN